MKITRLNCYIIFTSRNWNNEIVQHIFVYSVCRKIFNCCSLKAHGMPVFIYSTWASLPQIGKRISQTVVVRRHMALCKLVEFSYPAYTIQPVVQPYWQPAVSCKQTSIRLLNRLSNRIDNRLDVCLHDTAGCQTGLYNRFDIRVERIRSTRLSNRVVQLVWQPAVYTIQPVVKPVVKRFDNRLYRVNGASNNTGCRGFSAADELLVCFMMNRPPTARYRADQLSFSSAIYSFGLDT